jgi:IS5 family transposase
VIEPRIRNRLTMVRRLGQRVRTASPQVQPLLQRAQDRLHAMRPLVQRVVKQTRARVLGGDTHVPDKVLSVFEPQTETIRKGKISTPNEFGRLITTQESEHQIITAYDVHAKRPADVTLWTAALDRHQTIFGRAPDRPRDRNRSAR